MYLRKTIATSKRKPFVALISDFQPLINVTKNSISGVLDPSLEHYNVFYKLFRCLK